MGDWSESARDAMKRRGMTYAILASELGVHKTTVSNWMTGRKAPKAETIRRISSVLGITLPGPCDDMNMQECELVAAFRRMPADQRKMLLDIIKSKQEEP